MFKTNHNHRTLTALNKTVAFVLAVALMIPGVAGANQYLLSCGCYSFPVLDTTYYWKQTESMHVYMENRKERCPECWTVLYEIGEMPFDKDWEPHEFVGTRCRVCGYTKVRPKQEELRAAALSAGSNVIGKWVTIMYAGSLHSDHSKSSYKLKDVNEEQQFKVLDWYNERGEVWFQVEVNNSTAWVSSSIAKINEVTGQQSIEGLVGGKCQITAWEGQMKTQPGAEHRQVDTVFMYEKYEILDAAYASTGAIWYKIERYGKTGWIASGLTKLLEYGW